MTDRKATYAENRTNIRLLDDDDAIRPLPDQKPATYYLCPGLAVIIKSDDRMMPSYQGQPVYKVSLQELPGIRKTYLCQSGLEIEVLDMTDRETGYANAMESFYRMEKTAAQDDIMTEYVPWIRRKKTA